MRSLRNTSRKRGQVGQLCPEYVESRLLERAACSCERGKVSSSTRGTVLARRGWRVALAKDIEEDFLETKGGMHRGRS